MCFFIFEEESKLYSNDLWSNERNGCFRFVNLLIYLIRLISVNEFFKYKLFMYVM